jgi:hypothetical protein
MSSAASAVAASETATASAPSARRARLTRAWAAGTGARRRVSAGVVVQLRYPRRASDARDPVMRREEHDAPRFRRRG